MKTAFVSLGLRSLSLVAITGAAACDEPAELSALDRTALALGGHDAILAVTNERVAAEGDRYFPEQGASYTESRHLSKFKYVRTTELDTARHRIEHDHEHVYLYDGRYQFTEVVDGDLGFVTGKDAMYPAPPESAMFSSRVTAELQHTRLLSPLRVVREALADPSRVVDRGAREVDGRRYLVLAVAGEGEQPVELLIDARTHLPALAQRWEDTPPLGDVLIEARFEDYREVGGVAVPYRVDVRAGGLPLHAERRSSVELDVATTPETYAIPEAFRPPAALHEPRLAALGARSAELMTNIKYLALPVFHFDQEATPVGFDALAPGVAHVTGPTHHSLVVEMSDHLVVVEPATPFAGRPRAVRDAIEQRYPGKPIRYVVVSHFHNDHSGGVRHFLAGGGVTLVAGAPSVPFYERALANPHTVAPDALAQQPVPVAIQPVEDRTVLTDGARTVEVLRVPTTHANDMVVVYLPGEKILFTADLYNPNFFGPSNGQPLPNPKFAAMAAELYDEVTRRGLSIEKIAGGHGQGTATMEELQTGAGR